MTHPGRPAIFVHGLWLHASSWGPWLELFAEAGYAPAAPGWPGDSDTVEEARRNPSQVAGKGIDDVVDHYARIIRGLEAPPVVIGHSFGGLIAQRLLGQDLAAAAVAIDAAPIKGVLNLPVSALKVASIALRKPANRRLAISLTAEQFRYGFGNVLPEQESAELYDRWTVPSPGKPLFEAALANFTPRSPAKGEHRQQDPRAAAAHGWGQRSHRAAGHHDLDPQAVPQVTGHHRLHRAPRSRPLADDRPWLARGRAGSAGLARAAVTLIGVSRTGTSPSRASTRHRPGTRPGPRRQAQKAPTARQAQEETVPGRRGSQPEHPSTTPEARISARNA